MGQLFCEISLGLLLSSHLERSVLTKRLGETISDSCQSGSYYAASYGPHFDFRNSKAYLREVGHVIELTAPGMKLELIQRSTCLG